MHLPDCRWLAGLIVYSHTRRPPPQNLFSIQRAPNPPLARCHAIRVYTHPCAALVRGSTYLILSDFPLSFLSKAPSPADRCTIFFNVRRQACGRTLEQFLEATVTHTRVGDSSSPNEAALRRFPEQCQSTLAKEGGFAPGPVATRD